eukprot:403341798
MRKAITLMALSALYATTALANHGDLTYYWICYEADESGSGGKNTWLKTCDGNNIAKVTRHYAERVRVEGTGKLQDGRVINLSGCDCGDGFSCFDEIDQNRYPFGIGGSSNPIYPYSSVAANDFPIGTTLMIQQFQGVVMPRTGGQRHNGCVRVDDRGWGFGSNHIDFFVAQEKNYHNIDDQLQITSVDYYQTSCNPPNFNYSSQRSVKDMLYGVSENTFRTNN